MELEFSGEIFEWRGPAPYHFIAVPDEEVRELREGPAGDSYGWGMIPARVAIGDTEWSTSLWPRDGGYVVPLKDAVRKPAGLLAGDTVALRVTPDASRGAGRTRAPRRSAPSAPRTARGEPVTDEQLSIVPANEASWEDLQAIFGTTGAPALCWCQRFKMLRRESWASVGPEGLAARLREQTGCDRPDAAATSGLVAYLDGEPVGWCAVDPRPANPRLLRDCRVPWVGRTQDKSDDGVWAVTCFVTRIGFRRRGISRALARAAVGFARARGARALEGYPHLRAYEHVGTPRTFADAGLVEVNRPTTSRAVMRIDF